MSLLDSLLSRASEIRAFAAAHGASHVRVVGSVARRADRPDSDIDLLVRFEPGVGLLEHVALALELERLLGRRVEVAAEAGLRPRVRERLLADATSL